MGPPGVLAGLQQRIDIKKARVFPVDVPRAAISVA